MSIIPSSPVDDLHLVSVVPLDVWVDLGTLESDRATREQDGFGEGSDLRGTNGSDQQLLPICKRT